ncbi:MAG: hypothetical protein LAO19_16765 [Acidobacteriia bacterium]|nr:hypothetical protein [Terriglobia bacterium]
MKLRQTLSGLALLTMIGAASVCAQAQNSNSSGQGGGYNQRPAPAARGVSPGVDPLPNDPSQVTPDANTLSGAQMFGVGSLEHARNIFDPMLSFSELGQTYPPNPGLPNQSNLLSQTLLGGGFNFDRTWTRYHFTAIYNGGETLTRGAQYLNAQFHDANVMQEIAWARWRLLLRDDFVASPGASFTGTGMGGPGLTAQIGSSLESSLNSIGQAFVPSESIQTGNAMRYTNAAIGQLSYSFSRRSAFTFAGSYGLLKFTQSGYFSSHMVTGQAGYDFMLDPSDSIALLASYGKIDYTGSSNSTTNYLAALAFGRKITGRMAFQVVAGPEQIQFVNGTTGKLWYPSVSSLLTYDWRRASYSISFMRGLNSGSGVFLGAKSNILTLAAHRQFTRSWVGAINSGYAINESLAPTGQPTVRFDNWFVGGNLGRQLGPHLQLNFNYGVQRQNSPAVCPVASCGVNGFEQTFGVTVNWHLRRNG